MLKYRVLSVSIALALGLGACGGGGSDSSPGPTTSSNGVLVDDLIVGGTVFCDANDNGKLDIGEASAITDDNGVFTFPAGCDAPVVSVAGTGTDKTSRKAPQRLRAHARSAVVSHLTTMHVESGLSLADFKAVMIKLGLGDVDPSTFDPSSSANAAKAKTAMAVAKLLNDLAAIVSASGGDPEAAFAAAAKELASQLKSKTLTGASLFDNDVDLGDVVEAAADKAFDSVDDWKNNSQKKTNARKIAREGVSKTVKAIKNAPTDDDAKDSFRNEQTANDVADTDLSDDTACDNKAKEVKDDTHYTKARFIYSDSDAVHLVAPNEIDTSLTALASSTVSTGGQTLRQITRVEMPLRDPSKTLSKSGVLAMVALEVTEVGGNRKLQAVIDKVRLSRDTNVSGQIKATVPASAGMRFYARSGSGVELITSEPIRNVAANTLSDSGTGMVGIDLSVITNRLFSTFTGTANQALLNNLLDQKGTFDVKVVVTQIDFRYKNGTDLPYTTINLKLSSTKGLSVGGSGFTGRLQF